MPRSSNAPGRRGTAGYTLMELMIVVVIVGILATIATPSYRAYMLRTHRTTAKIALLSIATSQERYYLVHRSYGTLAQLAADNYPTSSDHNMYTITIEAADAATFTAKATAAVGTNGVDMTKDTKCAWFQITAEGVRTASSPDCW
ncbi:MAG TPA: type IV pilin protein [Gammaproteobacteria bacterium]|nr:type IV pilin protein [Gammaproteobacteria bacterium]